MEEVGANERLDGEIALSQAQTKAEKTTLKGGQIFNLAQTKALIMTCCRAGGGSIG